METEGTLDFTARVSFIFTDYRLIQTMPGMIHTVVSQQPGCVVEPSYVMKCSVSGSMALSEMCLTGVDAPEKE
ncbi:hypothetical protein GWI33_009260 [Rhynchophorus ferrugineus]|uniref:Uncharacterized protein n=1 Tax=Rhynchophorus ferrugineus TaxID=354439 RepID=A0A834IAS1_RHYFE|nr:hypothetical protein GWI33_009260 [Rhynchophorus ferrugineus]